MEQVKHDQRAHSALGASSAHRWAACPGSVGLGNLFSKDKSSDSADTGRIAHEMAEIALTKGISHVNNSKIHVDREIMECIANYNDYINAIKPPGNHISFVEEKVSYNHIIEGGFGTVDYAQIDHYAGHMDVVDLKTGVGMLIGAKNNYQLMLYASGIMRTYDTMKEVNTIRIHIVQPRLNNYSSYQLTRQDLISFEKWIKVRAEMTKDPNAPLVPGETQCRYCRAKAHCGALHKLTMDAVGGKNMDDVTSDIRITTDEQKKNILDNKSLIMSYLSAVESEVFGQLTQGGDFPGYKLVAGKSVRKWTKDGIKALENELGDEAYVSKPIGITAAAKLLGNKRVDELTEKPEGKPTMVPEDDKREALPLSKFVNLDK